VVPEPATLALLGQARWSRVLAAQALVLPRGRDGPRSGGAYRLCRPDFCLDAARQPLAETYRVDACATRVLVSVPHPGLGAAQIRLPLRRLNPPQ
jgi:hypothetical protein